MRVTHRSGSRGGRGLFEQDTEECKGGEVLPEGDNEEYKGSGLPGAMGCWKNTGVGVPQ